MRTITAAFLLATIAPAALSQTPIIAKGSRVRIDAPGVTVAPLEATIISISPDTIVVGDDNTAPLAVPRTALRSIELSQGKSGWPGVKKGFVIGTEWGAGTGIFVAAISHENCGSILSSPHACTLSTRLRNAGVVTGAGAFYGVVFGFLVGSEKWEKAELPTHSTIGLHDGKPALSWSLSF